MSLSRVFAKTMSKVSSPKCQTHPENQLRLMSIANGKTCIYCLKCESIVHWLEPNDKADYPKLTS